MSGKSFLLSLRNRWVGVGIFAAFLATTIVVGLWMPWLASKTEIPLTDRANSGTLDLTESNVFIGSQGCSECHALEWSEWQSHPMFRSTTLMSNRIPDEDFSKTEFSPLPHVTYKIESRDSAVFHHELMTDAEQKPIYDQSVEICYAMGSGQQGHAYLISHSGLLFASPINWYSGKRTWGLAPGYNPAGHPRFERRVTDACLNCHTGRVADDPDASDRLLEPEFHELPIGCERCHGAGGMHAAHHRSGEIADEIVNPKKLDNSRRDAICAQCHLQGLERVLRPGRTEFDFRPGMQLSDIWTVFVSQSSDISGAPGAVSHVEQMHASKCYLGSNGGMGCTSCHDPHAAQHGSQSDAHYRRQCLSCHAEQSCNAPVNDRSELNDSCMTCHMPVGSASDVAHAAHTNHRILRTTGLPDPSFDARKSGVEIFQDDPTAISDPERRRSLGIAMTRLIERGAISASPATAESLLREARSHFAEDVELMEALGTSLSLQRRTFEAHAIWKQALNLAPKNEALLFRLAELSHNNGAFEDAAEYIEQFLMINPWHAGMYGRHAHVMGSLGRFPEGIQSALKALELDPSLAQVHGWLAEACQKTSQIEASRSELEIFHRLKKVQSSGTQSLEFEESP